MSTYATKKLEEKSKVIKYTVDSLKRYNSLMEYGKKFQFYLPGENKLKIRRFPILAISYVGNYLGITKASTLTKGEINAIKLRGDINVVEDGAFSKDINHKTLFLTSGTMVLVIYSPYEQTKDFTQYIKSVLINLGAKNVETTKNDVLINGKKVVGIFIIQGLKIKNFITCIIFDYDVNLWETCVPEAERINGGRLGLSGITTEFPNITKELFLEEFTKNFDNWLYGNS